MPRRKTRIRLITAIPFGVEDDFTFYVKDDAGTWRDYTDFISRFEIVKTINAITEARIELIDIDATDRDIVKEKAEVMFFIGLNKLFFKGRIQKAEYASDGVTGLAIAGIETKLKDYEVETLASASGVPKRQLYEGVSFRTIIKELCSENGDGTAPWIIETGDSYIEEYGSLTVRFENLDRLSAIAKTCDAIKFDWYVDTPAYPFDKDYLRCVSHRGSTTSVYTLTTSGDNANATVTSRERDITSLVNDVTVLGRGDGINQIKANIYAGSSIYSKLAANISATDTTITLVDASDFPDSGEIIIGEERITYTGKSGNSLTGCTRGANGTTAIAHYKDVLVFKYASKTSPEAGSSIDTYGLMSHTLYKPDIIDKSYAELVASKYLEDHMTPVEKVVVKPYETIQVLNLVKLGDVVTISDPDAGTSGDYRLVRITYTYDEGAEDVTFELGNVKSRYVSEVQKTVQTTKETGTFMQGSTFMYMTGETDNCDANHGLTIDFYIPEDAVAINKVLLNYKVYPPRVFNTINPSGGSEITSYSNTAEDPSYDSIGSSGSFTAPQIPTWVEVVQIGPVNYHTDGIFVWVAIEDETASSLTHNHSLSVNATGDGQTNLVSIYGPAANADFVYQGSIDATVYTNSSEVYADTRMWYIRVHEVGTSNYYPSDGGVRCITASGKVGSSVKGTTGSRMIYLPGDWYNKKIGIQISGYEANQQCTMLWYVKARGKHRHTVDTRHTHSSTYSIVEKTATGTNITIKVDGQTIGTYDMSDQTSLDIKDYLQEPIAGAWHTVEINPNGNRRIKADIFIKGFTEAR